ncbi:MAG: hypothetical protein PHD81_04985 [Candidatus Nanoarchaeia archaeon]|nr:hypothetical protein [Candidatus Nanoarchaeia archaeon]MDD5588433.1 hypothetical protein [Candidatus Nanoarchaeia archaeon]
MAIPKDISLMQLYGQVITRFLTEAIIRFEAYKNKESRQEVSRRFGNLEGIVTEFRKDYGYGSSDFDRLFKPKEFFDMPTISNSQLLSCLHGYTQRYPIKFDKGVFEEVIDSMIKDLGLLKPIKRNKTDILYGIKTKIFEDGSLDKKSYSLSNLIYNKEEEFRFTDEDEAVLCESEEETRFYHNKKLNKSRAISKEILNILGNASFIKNIGRGYIYSLLYNGGVRYKEFMDVVNGLISKGIVVNAYSKKYESEVIYLNPQIKPFVLTKAILNKLNGHKDIIQLEEVENNMGFGPMKDYVDLGGNVNDKVFYSFDGPKGL